MKNPKLANLIDLCTEFETDAICFESEAWEEGQSPFEAYYKKMEDEICREMKMPNIPPNFLRYNWSGSDEQLPWNEDNGISFDPTLISVIIPISARIPAIPVLLRGEDRKIVLTQPATCRGERPFYYVSCASEKQIENVRVLNDAPARPFYGIQRIFENGGFESLPKLNYVSGIGMIGVCDKKIIAPKTSRTYF